MRQQQKDPFILVRASRQAPWRRRHWLDYSNVINREGNAGCLAYREND